MPWEKQFDPEVVLGRAMQLFWERGYEATSLQDLVEATGINRASLYGTYTDKRTLFLAALRRYDEDVRRRLVALETDHPPREAIRRLFAAFAGQLDQPERGQGCFLTNAALELSAHDREVRGIVAQAQEGLEAFFERQLRRGHARGEVSRRVRATDAARGLLAALIGLVVLLRSRPERPLIDAVVRDALRRLDER